MITVEAKETAEKRNTKSSKYSEVPIIRLMSQKVNLGSCRNIFRMTSVSKTFTKCQWNIAWPLNAATVFTSFLLLLAKITFFFCFSFLLFHSYSAEKKLCKSCCIICPRKMKFTRPASVKLQWHLTCGFDFRHSLWLPFVTSFAVLKGLLIVGTMDSF